MAEKMKATALRILSLRSHTRAELRKKLRLRGFPAPEVDPLLARLAEIGYLDDASAARGWVRRRLEDRPMGRRLMEQELRARGVAPSLVVAAAAEAYAGGAEAALARRAGEKRLRSLGDPADPRTRERLLRFLRGRGFPARVCLDAAGGLCPAGAREEEGEEEE